jgi:hypothetical protein
VVVPQCIHYTDLMGTRTRKLPLAVLGPATQRALPESKCFRQGWKGGYLLEFPWFCWNFRVKSLLSKVACLI